MIELLQLPIDQVGTFWPVMSKVIDRALPPMVTATPEHGTRLLKLLLTGQMQAWSIIDQDEDETQVVGYAVTQLLDDEVSGARSLLLYALAADDDAAMISGNDWRRLAEALFSYARGCGAARITAYTANERMLRLAESLGASTEYRFIALEV